MAFTDNAKNAIINELTGQTGTAFNYDSIYMGLFDNDGNELTSASCPGYARKLIGNPNQSDTRVFGAASGGTVTNTKDIMFDRATAAWTGVTVKSAGLFTAATGGAQLTLDDLTTPLTNIVQDMIVVIPAGQCTISFN